MATVRIKRQFSVLTSFAHAGDSCYLAENGHGGDDTLNDLNERNSSAYFRSPHSFSVNIKHSAILKFLPR